MKKIIVCLMMLLLCTFTAYASIDTECQDNGFDFGIAKWEWNDELHSFQLDEAINGFQTNVNGHACQADWNSHPGISGVITKEGNEYILNDGGECGHVKKINHDISHVTLCGNNNEIPEFPLVGGAAIPFGFGMIGYLLIRRKVQKK